MAGSAFVPRVRTIVICDDITASETEASVYNLEGVRQHLYALTFPWRIDLYLFLLLSSPRKGRYPGWIEIQRNRGERVIRHRSFVATFEEDNEILAIPVEIGNCVFPEPAQYTFQVHFHAPPGALSLRGEHPFAILSY